MWTSALHDHPQPLLQWGVVLVAALIAAVTDIRSRRIPNSLTGPLVLLGLVASAQVGGWSGLLDSFSACVILAFPFVLLFVFAGGGAGDAKFMGGLGAWLGVSTGAMTLASVCLVGVVMAVLYAQRRKRLRVVFSGIHTLTRGVLNPLFGVGTLRDVPRLLPDVEDGEKMPYGLAIFLGVTISAGAFLWQHQMAF